MNECCQNCGHYSDHYADYYIDYDKVMNTMGWCHSPIAARSFRNGMLVKHTDCCDNYGERGSIDDD